MIEEVPAYLLTITLTHVGVCFPPRHSPVSKPQDSFSLAAFFHVFPPSLKEKLILPGKNAAYTTSRGMFKREANGGSIRYSQTYGRP